MSNFATFFHPKSLYASGHVNSAGPSKELSKIVQAVLPALPVDEREAFRVDALRYYTVDGLPDELKEKIRALKPQLGKFAQALLVDL